MLLPLYTYDPHHPEWANQTPEERSDSDRNYHGMLIERPGPKTSEKRLCLFYGIDDSQEQASSHILWGMINELLSNSSLANRLLRKFSFLMFPYAAQQGVRDGFSRYPYDCPPPIAEYVNTNMNGMSRVGQANMSQAVENWLSDHPAPELARYVCGSLHCDVPQFSGWPDISNPTFPIVAPYAHVNFPAGVDLFKQGFNRVNWPELEQAATVIEAVAHTPSAPGGFQGYFYIEVPWRYAGHSPFFRGEQDAYNNLGRSFLAGISTVTDTQIVLESPDAFTANPDLMDIRVSLGITQSITRRVQMNTTAAALGGAVALQFNTTFKRDVPIGTGLGVTAEIVRHVATAADIGTGLGLYTVVVSGTRIISIDNAAAATGTGIQATITRRVARNATPSVGVGITGEVAVQLPGVNAHPGIGLGIDVSMTWREMVRVYAEVGARIGIDVALTTRRNVQAYLGTGFGIFSTGSWTVKNVPVPLKIRARDAAGNVSDYTTREILKAIYEGQTSIPILDPLPTATSLETLTVSGFADTGATVRVYANAMQVGSGRALNGRFTIPVQLPEGGHVISADATLPFYTTANAKNPQTVIIDRTTPPVPITVFIPENAQPGDLITLTGTAEPYATIEVYAHEGLLIRTSADAAGNWIISNFRVP